MKVRATEFDVETSLKRPAIFTTCLLAALDLVVGCALTPTARATAGEIAPTNSAFTQHLAGLAKQAVLVQPPFVLLGDEPPDVVRRRTIQTVKWAVDKLKQDFFQRDPQEIIDIC